MPITAAHLLGWFEGEEGYNVQTRNFAAALARRMPVYRTELPRRDGEMARIATAVAGHRRADDLANILFAWGDQASYLERMPGPRIVYVVWETSKLPDSWLTPLGAVDRLWAPSRWGRDVLIENGFAAGNIDVVPEGVDISVFHPWVPPAPSIAALPGFKFISIGRWQHRKGTADLLRAFDAEFAGDPGVRLVLGCHNPHRPDIDLRRELMALNLSCLDQVTFLAAGIPTASLAAVYAACDAGVYPTRADAWGLPITEAMATGLPVIATDFGGPADYLTAENSYQLDWRPAPCPWMPVTMADNDYGMWAEPDFDQLRRLMREVVENRTEARRRGDLAAASIREQWTWDHAAGKAAAVLDRL